MPAHRIILTIATVAMLHASASAQHRVGPIYPQREEPEFLQRIPQSGYDPFQLNWSTGRFHYVPIPYDPQPVPANYNPFRFNWYTGRWDYVPFPSPDEQAWWGDGVGGNASNYIETRIDPQQMALARRDVASAPVSAPPEIETRFPAPPPLVQPRRRGATTAPATAPTNAAATTRPAHDAPPLRPHLAGRWEYDYYTARWVYVLQGD